jgi:transcriptional regulator with XRE-family HTH domain
MTQQEPLTATIAMRVKELRKARGLSAEGLAEYMRKAGVPWRREVVANLEVGRRASVSVTELLALSVVLSVPPLSLLMSPDAEEMPYVPMDSVDAYRGLLWLLAETPLDVDSGAWQDATHPIRLVRRHHEELGRLRNALAVLAITERWAAEGREAANKRLDLDRLNVKHGADQLRQVRREMRARGMYIPEIVPEIIEDAAARGFVIDTEEN